jgi:hypothetical protein
MGILLILYLGILFYCITPGNLFNLTFKKYTVPTILLHTIVFISIVYLTYDYVVILLQPSKEGIDSTISDFLAKSKTISSDFKPPASQTDNCNTPAEPPAPVLFKKEQNKDNVMSYDLENNNIASTGLTVAGNNSFNSILNEYDDKAHESGSIMGNGGRTGCKANDGSSENMYYSAYSPNNFNTNANAAVGKVNVNGIDIPVDIMVEPKGIVMNMTGEIFGGAVSGQCGSQYQNPNSLYLLSSPGTFYSTKFENSSSGTVVINGKKIPVDIVTDNSGTTNVVINSDYIQENPPSLEEF